MTHRAERVALVSDVHGNAVALEAVLAEVDRAAVDLIVWGGDLTWGPLPEDTLRLVEPYRDRSIFVRGNAERALAESAVAVSAGDESALTERERWMLTAHGPEARAFLAMFVEGCVVEIPGLGAVRFCHGSPRSDEELITYATPEARIRALMDGVPERVLASAHTHIRFDRAVAGIRSLNPGSVGMPYEGTTGLAYWAVLGPDVELRSTPYAVDDTAARYRASGDPLTEQMIDVLLHPPTPAEVVEHAEARAFAG